MRKNAKKMRSEYFYVVFKFTSFTPWIPYEIKIQATTIKPSCRDERNEETRKCVSNVKKRYTPFHNRSRTIRLFRLHPVVHRSNELFLHLFKAKAKRKSLTPF